MIMWGFWRRIFCIEDQRIPQINQKHTQVRYQAVLLLDMSNGLSICLGLQPVHLLHGNANCPLPVSMITDCCCGGCPTNISTQQYPRLALPYTGSVCSGNDGSFPNPTDKKSRKMNLSIISKAQNIQTIRRSFQFITIIKNPIQSMGIFKKQDAAYWVVLAGIILLVYFLFSDGEFSLVFTLSGTVQTFGFALVVLKIRKSRSVGGLSRETFICYTLIFAIRAVLFMFYKGYLPFDSSGDFIFKFQQILATALAGYILYCIVGPFKTSYNRDLDVIKSWYLIIVAAVFAVLFHSNLNRSVWADFGWAFSQYLQTIAILSQFILFNKKGGEIQTYTSHFIAAQAISRILSLIFWIFTYTQLNEYNREKASSLLPEYVGYWFMVTQVVHLFIMADFMYYWVKAVRRGEGVQLPTYI